MSDKSDEISDVSEGDVSEGTVANPVFVSQIDPSLSQIEALKPIHKTSKTTDPRELRALSSEKDRISPLTKKTSKKICSFPIRFDPNSYNFTICNESSKRISQKTPNMIAKNIKNIKLIPQSIPKAQGDKPPPRKSLIDIDARFYEYQRKVEEKLQKKREERDLETEECTFHPKITTIGRSRSFEEFYSDALKYDQHRKRKLKDLRNDKSEENFTFKPKISGKSSFLMQSKNIGNCFDRLCKANKSQSQTKSFYYMTGTSKDFLNYVPLNSKLTRPDLRHSELPTNLIFSETARKRKKVNYENQPVAITTSQNSIKILVKGFLKEFSKQSNLVDFDRTGKLNYTRYIDILRAMKFYRETPSNEEIVMVLEIWDILAGSSGYANIEDLKVLLMGVMGFYQPWMESHSQLTLSFEEVSDIHEKYSMLFKTRFSLNSKFKSPENKATRNSDEKNKGFYDKMSERADHRKKRHKEFKEKIEMVNTNNTLAPILEYPTFSTAPNDTECQPKLDLLKVPGSNDSFNSMNSDTKVAKSNRRAPTRGTKRTSSLQPQLIEPLSITIALDELVNFKAEEKMMNDFVRKTLNPGILTIKINKV